MSANFGNPRAIAWPQILLVLLLNIAQSIRAGPRIVFAFLSRFSVILFMFYVKMSMWMWICGICDCCLFGGGLDDGLSQRPWHKSGIEIIRRDRRNWAAEYNGLLLLSINGINRYHYIMHTTAYYAYAWLTYGISRLLTHFARCLLSLEATLLRISHNTLRVYTGHLLYQHKTGTQ